MVGGTLQLCKAPQEVLDSAYRFGQKYRQKCRIKAQELWNINNSTDDFRFYDLYLEIQDDDRRVNLYPLYVLNLNVDENSAVQPDPMDKENRGNWRMTRRFFLVDNVAGKDDWDTMASVVRYPELMQLNVELRTSKDGKIYPPYLTIKYGEVRSDQFDANPELEVEFAVEYYMDTERHEKDLEITMGVLCSFGGLWAMLRAWSWSKRAGKAVIDFPTVLKCILYLAGTISDIFFVVMLGTCLVLTFAYKAQLTVVYMMLTSTQEGSFVIYICLAAALKVVEMVHVLLEQVSAEVFFIDWERPHGTTIPRNVEVLQSREQEEAAPGRRGSQSAADENPQNPITIWRTYLVANEWNELQAYRKTSYVLQLCLMILFLKVLNFEGLTVLGPGASLGEIILLL